METNNRKSVYEDLSKFDYLAKSGDYIEVTRWTNSEGIDISIYSRGTEKVFPLTDGELKAINFLNTVLESNIESK